MAEYYMLKKRNQKHKKTKCNCECLLTVTYIMK